MQLPYSKKAEEIVLHEFIINLSEGIFLLPHIFLLSVTDFCKFNTKLI